MDLYCKILVQTDHDRAWLLEQVCRVVGGSPSDWSAIFDGGEIEVRNNEDADSARFASRPDGFLFSRYALESEPTQGTDSDAYIKTIGHLLDALWTAGCGAVAACDFESRLPRSGGFRCG